MSTSSSSGFTLMTKPNFLLSPCMALFSTMVWPLMCCVPRPLV